MLAIDIALLLPHPLVKAIRAINAKLWDETHAMYRMDRTHLPHISLLQMYVDRSALRQLMETLTSPIKNSAPLRLRTVGIASKELTPGHYFHTLNVRPTKTLRAFHHRILKALRPFARRNGTSRAFVRDPRESISPLSIRWTQNFLPKHSGRHFRAHITLGIGSRPRLQKQFHFAANRLALCQLGNFNSCRKVLAEWKLK